MSEVKCQCRLCIEMNKFFEVIGKLSEEDQAWMTEFYSRVDCERLDANVNEAILNGTWPNAIEQLEVALHKAKQIREERNG